MAYLLGLVSKGEARELKRRGWELDTPAEMVKEIQHLARDMEKWQGGFTKWDSLVGVFVDADLFAVMDGPDWEKGDKQPKKRERLKVQRFRDKLWRKHGDAVMNIRRMLGEKPRKRGPK